jgi:hypothetical protein
VISLLSERFTSIMTGKKIFDYAKKYDVTISRYFYELVHVPYLKNESIFFVRVLCTVVSVPLLKKGIHRVFLLQLHKKRK